MRHQRDRHRLRAAASSGAVDVDRDAAVLRDRRHRALVEPDELDRRREPVGDRLERRDRDSRPHPLCLDLVVGEREPRQDVAAGALEEDAFAAGRRADDAAQRPREVGRVDVHVVAGRDGMAAVADERRDRRLVGAARLQGRHLGVDELVRVPAEDRAAVRAARGALAPVDGDVGGPPGPRRRARARAARRRAAPPRRSCPGSRARTRRRRTARPRRARRRSRRGAGRRSGRGVCGSS